MEDTKTNCPNHADTKLQIKRVEEDLRLVVQEIATMKQNAVSLDASTKSAHKRLDDLIPKVEHLEQRSEEMLKLTLAIEKLAESIKSNNDALAEHDARLDNVERSAGNFMVKVAQGTIFTIVGAVVTFLLLHFGIGG